MRSGATQFSRLQGQFRFTRMPFGLINRALFPVQVTAAIHLDHILLHTKRVGEPQKDIKASATKVSSASTTYLDFEQSDGGVNGFGKNHFDCVSTSR